MSESRRHPGRALIVSAVTGAALIATAFGLSACTSAVAEDAASVSVSPVASAPTTPSAHAIAQPAAPPTPPTKAFCKDLAALLNSKPAHELIAAEVNLDSNDAHTALPHYIPKLQRFIDALDPTTPNAIRSTLGQFNTNLQNKILQRTITADDLDLIKYTDDDLRHYAVTTCGQRLRY